MAKRKTKAPTTPPTPRWRTVADTTARMAALMTVRQWLSVLGLIAIVAGVAIGLRRLDHFVHNLPEANATAKLRLVDMPDWAEQEGWAPRITASLASADEWQWNDPNLTQRIVEHCRRDGWVKNVAWVRKAEDGTVQVACTFRRPIAMVQTRLGFIPVDAEGYRLPEVYDRLTPGWIRIAGVRSEPPAVGERWNAEDLEAGVMITSWLFDRSVGTKIATVDVSNHDGHRPNETRIRLIAQNGMEIRWGSAPGREIDEPTPDEKIRNIEHRLRVDPDRRWIDVSVYSNAVIAPRADGPGVQMVVNQPNR